MTIVLVIIDLAYVYSSSQGSTPSLFVFLHKEIFFYFVQKKKLGSGAWEQGYLGIYEEWKLHSADLHSTHLSMVTWCSRPVSL